MLVRNAAEAAARFRNCSAGLPLPGGQGDVLTDAQCVDFLQWALPRLGLRWAGFRRVRRQVCRRVQRRISELGATGADGYRQWLERNPAEWSELAALCRIPISRFFRDRWVFERLERDVLPELARTQRVIRAWSAGCASGEEPYSLALLWQIRVAPRLPGASLLIIASDVDERLLERARRACYTASSLREIPEDLRQAAFERSDGRFVLRSQLRQGIEFRREDVRREGPPGSFALVLCRNLAFTYFDRAGQLETLTRIRARLRAGGYLIVGAHESLPVEARGFARSPLAPEIYRAA
jgi:chemotaxis protein methyltransferase CheR